MPYGRRPSRWPERAAVAVVLLAGLGWAAALAYVSVMGVRTACGGP